MGDVHAQPGQAAPEHDAIKWRDLGCAARRACADRRRGDLRSLWPPHGGALWLARAVGELVELCWGERGKGAGPCWSVAGAAIDRAVEQLFVDTMVPSELDLSLAVEREVQQQSDSLDKAWRTRIEQARYEARRAERRYKAVDPDNRVVARTLETDRDHRLRDLEAVEQQYVEARRLARVDLTAQDRDRVRQLARDLPAVWAAPTTLLADRKAMLRLVIEAVALHPVDVPRRSTRIRVQWTSGAVDELAIPRLQKGEYRANAPAAIQRIAELAAAGVRDDEIAL